MSGEGDSRLSAVPASGDRARTVVLALDAALAGCSAAVLRDGAVLAQAAVQGERGHAATLPPMAAEVLARAGLTAPQLDAVAVVVGPGGFTGLRAALALAQGIALAAGLPLVGITTGEALAEALPAALRQRRAVWTGVDTKRGRFILERFLADGSAAAPPQAMAEADLPRPDGPVAVAGDAAAAIAARLLARGFDAVLTGSRRPDAVAVGRVALQRLRGERPMRDATPLYVEPPAVRLPAVPAG